MALGRTWHSLLTIVHSRLHPQQPWRVPNRVGEGPGKVTVCTPLQTWTPWSSALGRSFPYPWATAQP